MTGPDGPSRPTRAGGLRSRRAAGMFAVLVGLLLVLAGPAGAARAAGGEGMDSFVAAYDLQPDGSMKVTETITWRFPTGQQRHGIFRNIVVRMGYGNQENRYRYFDLTDVAVSSPSGAPDTFRVIDNGAAKQIRIGSGSEYTSGTQVYKVSYTLHNVLNPITADGKPATGTTPPATVELNYNVFGSNELTERDRVSVTVNAPAAATKVLCFSGPTGSTTECSGSPGDPSRFSAGPLASGDAMTVIASYPASAFGDVRPDVRNGGADSTVGSEAAPAVNAAAWIGGVGAPILALAVMGMLVWTRGRDERYAGLTPGLSPVPSAGGSGGSGAGPDGPGGPAVVRG